MSTEFKSFDEMTPEELANEHQQTWTVHKSDASWWIRRNGSAFMPCHSEERAVSILEQYGINVYAVDRSQRAATAEDFEDMRRNKMRLMDGKRPSVARRVWRWLGGDAA